MSRRSEKTFFSKIDIQMVNRHLKICSISLTQRKASQNDNKMSPSFDRRAVIKRTRNTKNARECGERGTLRTAAHSVAQSCLTLCNPMDCSTPGLPVHHQLLKLAQTHAHQIGDTIQPSHSFFFFLICSEFCHTLK